MKKKLFSFLLFIFLLVNCLWVTKEPHIIPKSIIKQDIKPNIKPRKIIKASRHLSYIEKEAIITFYCSCFKCTGKHPWDKDYLITASGIKATPYHTVALPEPYPFGTIVKVEDERLKDYIFVCEDRGGAIKEIDSNTIKIDIFVSSHEEALTLGKLKRKVKLIIPFR